MLGTEDEITQKLNYGFILSEFFRITFSDVHVRDHLLEKPQAISLAHFRIIFGSGFMDIYIRK